MTQQQMSPPRQLPTCPAGHVTRYILDGRRLEARGGHFIECRCSRTPKCPSFDLAWAHWHKIHGMHPRLDVSPVEGSNVVQLGLRLIGGPT
jgi:hypothetical protein